MNDDSALNHFEVFAKEYDKLSKKHYWYSPEILFGLVFEYVKPKEKILDIGIGTGLSSIPFYKIGLEIYGIDGSKEMLRVCKGKKIAKKLILFDLRNKKLPYRNKKFNHIISSGVFYFFEDLEPFFKEASRLIKKNGTFSFNIEIPKAGYSEKYINKDNDLISKKIINKKGVLLFRHNPSDIHKLIKKYDFKVLKSMEYLAYKSSTENKNIYLESYVLRN